MFNAEQLEDFKEAFRLFLEQEEEGQSAISKQKEETIHIDSFCTLVRAIGFCPSDAELQELLKDLANLRGDGLDYKLLQHITFEEFITVISRKLSALHAPAPSEPSTAMAATGEPSKSLFNLTLADRDALSAQLLEAFRVFDPQNTQNISSDELYKLLTSLGEKLSDKEATQLLREADPSDSGKIHYPSLVKLLTSL